VRAEHTTGPSRLDRWGAVPRLLTSQRERERERERERGERENNDYSTPRCQFIRHTLLKLGSNTLAVILRAL